MMSHLTPYPDVNQVLHEFVSGVHTALGKQCVGVYLYGSLALGDFDPVSSDIDFVVVTDDELSTDSVSALAALHSRIALNHPRWATELEGSYIPKADIGRYDPARAYHLHLYRGHVEMEQHGVHWVIERHVLREHGVVLSGPEIRTLISPISPDDLRRATAALMEEWWAPKVDEPGRAYVTKYQSYAVVTMCRVLYTLQHGTVVSKPAAARWAREGLGQRWGALIGRTRTGGSASDSDLVDETCDFIRHALERCKRYQ
ncbi:MAG TPA: aminoglycoside adenylyltransferase domain-containing protein [Symbiobacteriaceae bacterium]|nr:aminoglycoside adenylyltransferase domain-containing protein [Symbiobacteriaceae bacterium]